MTGQVRLFNGIEALKLFKTYEAKGWAVKEHMLKSVTWLTPTVFGLLAFAAREYFVGQPSGVIVVALWTAFFLSSFILILVVFSLSHANDDYTRSRSVAQHIIKEKLLPDDIVKVIQGEEDKEVWLEAFRYVGWQFKCIMILAVVLAVGSLVAALFAGAVHFENPPAAVREFPGAI